jgi:hypothetical protein
MAAPTNYYADPLNGSDSTGDGTIGTPWKSVQKALNTIARNTTSGDQVNVKSGGIDTLSSALTLATYGNPYSGNFGAPLVIRGYTSAANDGGQGEISGGGLNIKILDAYSLVHFIDMKLGNCGTTWVLGPANACLIFRCELHAAAYAVVNATGIGMNIVGNSISGMTTESLQISGHSTVIGNYISQTAGTAAIRLGGASTLRLFERNIISVSGGVHGLLLDGYYWRTINNTILSAGGTGTGIRSLSDFGSYGTVLMNNYVEGFSGVGGVAILMNQTAQQDAQFHDGNAVFNCTTGYSYIDQRFPDIDNETLGATGLSKSGANSFANRFTYFAPVAVGNMLAGAFPFGSGLSKGAVQAAASAGFLDSRFDGGIG